MITAEDIAEYMKTQRPQGWRTCQNPRELEMMFRVFAGLEFEPKSMMEVGSFYGGFAALMGITYPIAKMVIVDMKPELLAAGKRHSADLRNATIIKGDSRRDETISAAREAVGDGVDFLHIDGAHDYPTAKSDFANYAPMVKDGGIIALHDIRIDWPEGSVRELWRELEGEYWMLAISCPTAVKQLPQYTPSAGIGLVWKGKPSNMIEGSELL